MSSIKRRGRTDLNGCPRNPGRECSGGAPSVPLRDKPLELASGGVDHAAQLLFQLGQCLAELSDQGGPVARPRAVLDHQVERT